MDPIPNPIHPSSSSSSSATTTTYVQADPLSFRDVVQRLTGSSTSAAAAAAEAVAPRRAPFKLRERRGGELHLRLSPSPLRRRHHHHHHHHHRSSSSFAGAQSPTTPSPKSPLGSDPLFSPPPAAASSPSPGKEAAIAENRFFFLHPSPRILAPAPAAAPAAAAAPASPELLPLFPLSSPAQRRRGDEESSIGDKPM